MDINDECGERTRLLLTGGKEKQRERITLEDDLRSAIIKVAEGNPGALAVCISLAQDGPIIDPDSALGPLTYLLSLDAHGIYGHRIWGLYKDVCGENLVYMCATLRAVQLGLLSIITLQNAIDLTAVVPSSSSGINVVEVLNTVIKRLPKFFAKGYTPTLKP